MNFPKKGILRTSRVYNTEVMLNVDFSRRNSNLDLFNLDSNTVEHTMNQSVLGLASFTDSSCGEKNFSTSQAVLNFGTFNISGSNILLFKAKIQAESLLLSHQPYKNVKNALDDLRLGAAQISVSNGALKLSIFITNQGIWALYEVNSARDSSSASFSQVRRLASRLHHSDQHELAIEYNSITNNVSFMVEGKSLWSIPNLGIISSESNAKLVRTNGNTLTQANRPSSLQLKVSLTSALDFTDPNGQGKTALVRTNPLYPCENGTKFESNTLLNSPHIAMYRLRSVEVNSTTVKVYKKINSRTARTLKRLFIVRNSNPYGIAPNRLII